MNIDKLIGQNRLKLGFSLIINQLSFITYSASSLSVGPMLICKGVKDSFEDELGKLPPGLNFKITIDIIDEQPYVIWKIISMGSKAIRNI